MSLNKSFSVACLALAAALGAGSSLALISEDEVTELALDGIAAEVQSTQMMHRNGRDIWNVRLIDDEGVTLVRYFDANTGEELDDQELDIEPDSDDTSN